jgi:hypothetical protein
MAKSTKDFTIKIGDDKPKVSLRRSTITDEKTIDQVVDQVVTNKTKPVAPTAKTKPPAESKTKNPAAAKKTQDDKELVRLLSNKRLTIDIPFYLHDALREHNFRNRSTTKEIINDYLHSLLKVKDIRDKK